MIQCNETIKMKENNRDTPYTFEKNNKVAQKLIQKIERAEIKMVDELDVTSRGEKGFGSID